MKDFKILDENLVIPLKNTLRTKQQKYIFSRLVEKSKISAALRYINSFKGQKYNLTLIDRHSASKTDRLAEKEPGGMVKLFQEMMSVTKSHVPRSNDVTWIGVEIECCIPYKSVDVDPFCSKEIHCDRCDGTGIQYDDNNDEIECSECDGRGTIESGDSSDSEDRAHEELAQVFKNNKIVLSNIKGDGSIDTPNDKYFAVEITVLTRLDRLDNLKKVCQILNDLGATVNKSCGMHVHLDARHLSLNEVKDIGKKFNAAMPTLATLVPKTRRKNEQYCKLGVSGFTGSRYYACNLTAFRKYKTIEIRLHSSTTDFNKIIQWSKLISSVMYSTKLKKKCINLNDLVEFIDIDQDTMEYFSQREALFNEENNIKTSAKDIDSTDPEPEAQLSLNTMTSVEVPF